MSKLTLQEIVDKLPSLVADLEEENLTAYREIAELKLQNTHLDQRWSTQNDTVQRLQQERSNIFWQLDKLGFRLTPEGQVLPHWAFGQLLVEQTT